LVEAGGGGLRVAICHEAGLPSPTALTGPRIRGDYRLQMTSLSLVLLTLVLLLSLTLSRGVAARAEVRV